MTEEAKNNNNQINWLLFPIMNIYYILVNFLNGLLFVFVKFTKMIFEIISYNVNKVYTAIAPKKADQDKKVKEKSYKYSAKTISKLEKEREVLQKELQDPNAVRSKETNTYYYVAKSPEGKIVKDTMSGFSKADVNAFLVSEGYEVYSIKTSDTINLSRIRVSSFWIFNYLGFGSCHFWGLLFFSFCVSV